MDLLYTLDGDDLVLELAASGRIDRRAALERLAQLGAPLVIERDAISTKGRMPREGLPKLRSALTMLGGRLLPAPGQPPLDNVKRITRRYEEVRPFDPDEIVAVARKDEQPGAVLRDAMDRLRSFALAEPGFKDRVERDLAFLAKARERFAPQREEQADEPDPVRRAVSTVLRGVPEADLWRARSFLLELHQVAGDLDEEPPRGEVPDPIPGFLGNLRDYQEEGVAFLLGRGLNAILADDMGLGKTIMTIAAVLAADERALVVAPANVLHNWAAEVERFTGEEPALWHGRTLSGPDDARFRITTYDSLRSLAWQRTDAAERGVLVLDEAHMVRNSETHRSRLVADLPQERRILLTGTPIINGLPDYNELLLAIGERRWANAEAFRETWLKDRQVLARHGAVRRAAADLLQRATRHAVLRRRKDDVLDDLPPRTIAVDRHVLTPEEMATYVGLEQRAREVMAASKGGVEVFAQLHALRQHVVRSRIPLLLERTRELVEAGEAVVLFSQYLEPLDVLAEQLGDQAAQLTGSTAPRRREELARTLGTPDGPQVLLAQIEAGGVGLNLVGARTVLFAHLGWTAAVHRQAIDRVHRIGQDRPVQVELYVSPGTIDERLADLILEKEADANLALAEAGDVLNRAELAKALLADDRGTSGSAMDRRSA